MIWQSILWLFGMCLGISGGMLVGYSAIATLTSSPWPVIERHGSFLSSLLTLVGTLVTASSVYFPIPGVRPALPLSTLFISPVVILASLVALFTLLRRHKLPANLVNGFALVAIAGALLRGGPLPY